MFTSHSKPVQLVAEKPYLSDLMPGISKDMLAHAQKLTAGRGAGKSNGNHYTEAHLNDHYMAQVVVRYPTPKDVALGVSSRFVGTGTGPTRSRAVQEAFKCALLQAFPGAEKDLCLPKARHSKLDDVDLFVRHGKRSAKALSGKADLQLNFA